ncbi:MAG: type 4a pilus biogenesis protein PilO [Deltaproteobacteria bacterium]|nr:type 4a pilus biogenesis protein PilO [Deltaproteobacteria bacterium]
MNIDTSSIKVALDAFLENKAVKLNTNHKLMICAAVVLLPITVFYLLSYSPKSDQVAALRGNIASLRGQIATAKIAAKKFAGQKAVMAEIEKKFKKASRVIPNNKEIPSLLTSISSKGTAAGLDILSFKPGAERPHDFYAEIPVALSVKGSYDNIGHFLDTVSKLPRIVNLADMNLTSPTVRDGEVVLRASLNLVTYKFIEPSKGAKKKRAKK